MRRLLEESFLTQMNAKVSKGRERSKSMAGLSVPETTDFTRKSAKGAKGANKALSDFGMWAGPEAFFASFAHICGRLQEQELASKA